MEVPRLCSVIVCHEIERKKRDRSEVEEKKTKEKNDMSLSSEVNRRKQGWLVLL